MSDHHSNVFRRLGFVGCFLCVLFYWAAFIADRYAYDEWGRVLKRSNPPILANGLRLPLEPFVDSLQLSAKDYLAIVTADDCGYCLKEVGAWLSLLESIRLDGDEEVLLLTTSGRNIPSQLEKVLKRRGARYQILNIEARAAFGQRTGISWTPETLVLDREFRIRISSERVTPTVRELVLRWFDVNPG